MEVVAPQFQPLPRSSSMVRTRGMQDPVVGQEALKPKSVNLPMQQDRLGASVLAPTTLAPSMVPAALNEQLVTSMAPSRVPPAFNEQLLSSIAPLLVAPGSANDKLLCSERLQPATQAPSTVRLPCPTSPIQGLESAGAPGSVRMIFHTPHAPGEKRASVGPPVGAPQRPEGRRTATAAQLSPRRATVKSVGSTAVPKPQASRSSVPQTQPREARVIRTTNEQAGKQQPMRARDVYERMRA